MGGAPGMRILKLILIFTWAAVRFSPDYDRDLPFTRFTIAHWSLFNYVKKFGVNICRQTWRAVLAFLRFGSATLLQ